MVQNWEYRAVTADNTSCFLKRWMCQQANCIDENLYAVAIGHEEKVDTEWLMRASGPKQRYLVL